MESTQFPDDSNMFARAVSELPKALQDIAERLDEPTLHVASAAGELELVRALLDAGLAPDAYPCTEDEDDEPPLTWIARYRDRTSSDALEVASLLIERGAGLDEGLPLLAAAEHEDLSLMRLLLVAGADSNLALKEAEPKEARLLRQVIARGWHTNP